MADTKQEVNEKKVLMVERRALRFTMFMSFIAAACGIAMYFLVKSEAIRLDGIFSLINLIAALIASRVAIISIRKPSSRSPFGTQSSENVFLLFRSLFLTVYLIMTLFSAASVMVMNEQKEVLNGTFLGYDQK